MELAEAIVAVRAGDGDPAVMVGEFRRTAVLLPVTSGGFMAAEEGGIRWLYAFTTEEALARFALTRGEVAELADADWEFVAVLGARVLDRVIPDLGVPAGVAVDVADEEGSMLFPPVRGIVPDAVAVDLEAEGGAG